MRRIFASIVAIAVLISGPAAWRAAVAVPADVANPEAFFTFVGPPIEGLSQLEWLVTLNVTYLETLPATAVMNLPDRPAAILTKMRGETRGPGTFLWTGSGEGCTVVLNVAPTNVIGSISCITGNYSLLGNPSSQTGHLTLQHFAAAVAPIPVASTPALLSIALFVLSFGLVAIGRGGSRRHGASI